MSSNMWELTRGMLQFSPAGGGESLNACHLSQRALDVLQCSSSEATLQAMLKPFIHASAEKGNQWQTEGQQMEQTIRSSEGQPTGGCRDTPVHRASCFQPALAASHGNPNSDSSVHLLHAVGYEALDPCSFIDPLFNVATVYIKEELEDEAVRGRVKGEAVPALDKASTSRALLSAGVGGTTSVLLPCEKRAAEIPTCGNSGQNASVDAAQLLLLAESHGRSQGLTSLASYSSKKFFKEEILKWSEDGNMFDMMKRISKAKIPEPKIHQCPQCGFTFARKRCLERHMMAKHSDIRPYRCALCEYSSAFKSCLKKHTLVKHSGIKPFQCTHCEYSTPYRKDLDRHVMVRHSSFRPFQCSLCDFSCADISNLKRHTRVKHFEASPYHCTQCDYSSADKSNLRRHIKAKHSDDKPFQCSLCECAYSRKDKLKYHFRTRHSDL